MIAGYFAWLSTNKDPTSQKYVADRVGHLVGVLIEHPLSEDEMKLSLDELGRKYPLEKKANE